MDCSLPGSSVMGFFRQYWNGSPCPPLGDLPDQEIEPVSCISCISRQVLYHYHHLGSQTLRAAVTIISIAAGLGSSRLHLDDKS